MWRWQKAACGDDPKVRNPQRGRLKKFRQESKRGSQAEVIHWGNNEGTTKAGKFACDEATRIWQPASLSSGNTQQVTSGKLNNGSAEGGRDTMEPEMKSF